MNKNELLQEISRQDADISGLIEWAIQDQEIRDEVLTQMLTHPHIMVYYHSFYVIAGASERRPDLFYPYWQRIVPLLAHPNSYHRDFALTILANLTRVDRQNLFPAIFNDYFAHVQDEKMMTAQCCIRNSLKILRNKPDLGEQILALLLDIDRWCPYPEKQKELLKADILEIVDESYGTVGDTNLLQIFIRANMHSRSPKTRRKAKELAEKYRVES